MVFKNETKGLVFCHVSVIIDHGLKTQTIKKKGAFFMQNRIPEFDHRGYTTEQIHEALTCPVNRHTTRIKYACNDYDLFLNPQWLLENYIKEGGAEGFAKRRSEYKSLCEQVETCPFGEDCELALARSRYSMCPIRKLNSA